MHAPKPIPFDSLNLYAVLQERSFFTGGRIQEIRQPDALTIVLHIYAQRVEHRLLISADAQHARMHCISHKTPNAPTPPPFLQSLRKHIDGGIIRSLQMVGFDRIVQFEIQTREGVYRLMVELMGKHSNIILVEPVGVIRSAIKWVSPRQSEARPIRAGEPYQLPPTRVAGLLNPLTMSDDWRALWERMGAERDWQAHLEGLSRFTAGELEAIARARGLDGVLEWAYRLREGLWEPVAIREPQTRRVLGAYPFRSMQFPPEWQHSRASVNLAWEQVFAERIQQARVDSLRQSLLPNLRRALEARQRAAAELQRALQDSQQADRWRLYGELILAYGHKLPPGAVALHAPDYTQPETPLIEIPIDPDKTVAENAERYFQKARRARESRAELQNRLERLQDELAQIQGALLEMERTPDEATLRQIQEQAKAHGWLREASPLAPAKRAEKDPFEGHKIRLHLSPDGYQVLIGENAQANDFLLTRIAKPNDWWLHVRTGTGAHVIIRTENQPQRAPRSTLEFAARLAAQHSADKHARVVEVDYTLRKYVRKPKGAPPGFALYTHEKTLRVEMKP